MELNDATKEALVSIINNALDEAKPKTEDDRREVITDVLKILPSEHTSYFIKLYMPATPKLPISLPGRKGVVPPKRHPDEYDSDMPPFLRIRYKKRFHLKEPKQKPKQIRITANLKRRPKNTHTRADLANLNDRSNMPYMGSKQERLGYVRRVLFSWPHATFRVVELNGTFQPPQGYMIKASFTVMTVFQIGAASNPISHYKVWALYDRINGQCWALWHELTDKPTDTDCVIFYEHSRPKSLTMLTSF